MAVYFGIAVFLVTLVVGFASTLIETLAASTIILSATAYGTVSGAIIWMMETERDKKG